MKGTGRGTRTEIWNDRDVKTEKKKNGTQDAASVREEKEREIRKGIK